MVLTALHHSHKGAQFCYHVSLVLYVALVLGPVRLTLLQEGLEGAALLKLLFSCLQLLLLRVCSPHACVMQCQRVGLQAVIHTVCVECPLCTLS